MAWFIAVGFEQMKDLIRNATSDRLGRLHLACGAGRRAVVQAAIDLLKTDLIDYYTDKCAYLCVSPYVAVGAFYSVQSGPVAQSRQILMKMFAEVDQIVAAGHKERLHRVVLRLWVFSNINISHKSRTHAITHNY